MKNLKNFLFTLVLPFFVMGITTSANAQMCAYGDPSYGSSDCQIQRHGTNNDQAEVWRQQQQQTNQAEAQRQWQIREDAVQARIAKFRSTPYYGVIVANNSSFAASNGYESRDEAIKKALALCKTNDCQVVATYHNSCIALADANNQQNTPIASRKIFVATDADANNALRKAQTQCEDKFGENQCGLWFNAQAKCSGYDFGSYGH